MFAPSSELALLRGLIEKVTNDKQGKRNDNYAAFWQKNIKSTKDTLLPLSPKILFVASKVDDKQ